MIEQMCSDAHSITLRIQPYLQLIHIKKCGVSLSRVKVSAHRLAIETGRWHKPIAVPVDERKCRTLSQIHLYNVVQFSV